MHLNGSLGLNTLDGTAPSTVIECTALYIIKPTEIHNAFDWTPPQILQDWPRLLGPLTEPFSLSQSNENSRAGSATSSGRPQPEGLP